MDIGVFIPIGNNGWLISTSSPQYRPTFELNKQVVQKAEHYGLDFALSMIKLRGFGGKSEIQAVVLGPLHDLLVELEGRPVLWRAGRDQPAIVADRDEDADIHRRRPRPPA